MATSPGSGRTGSEKASSGPPTPKDLVGNGVSSSAPAIPWSVRWREFRVRFLPVVWFGTALVGVAMLWPTAEQVNNPLRRTAARRQQDMLWQAQFVSHSLQSTNAEGQFSALNIQ